MNIESIKKLLENYTPFNEQEEKDRALILHEIKDEKILYRSNLSEHITVSAWVVNPSYDKVLMAYHNIYDSWAWLGGHADGEADLKKVALKEATEESGIQHAKIALDDIFSVEVLTVDGHIKKGEYVPSHLHLNFTYLIVADENDALRIKEDENSNVAWFTFDEAISKSNEPWFKQNIYPKLIEKTVELKGRL